MDNPVKINVAAKLLNEKPSVLRQTMKARGVLTSKNLPRHDLVEQGLFQIKTGRYRKGKTGILGDYATTLVTGSGLAFLGSLIEEAKQSHEDRSEL